MGLRDTIVKEKIVCYKCYTYLNSSVHADGRCTFSVISDTIPRHEADFVDIRVIRTTTLLSSGMEKERARQQVWLKLFGDKI